MKKEPLISFQLRKALAKKNGMVPIYCCLRYNNTRWVFNIKIDVFPSEWDGNNTRVIGPRKRELNLQLENIRISILRKYDELSSICCFNYRTYMNFLAISPHIIQSVLQNQNIKLETFNKLDQKKKDK